jgi:hypothetical protein
MSAAAVAFRSWWPWPAGDGFRADAHSGTSAAGEVPSPGRVVPKGFRGIQREVLGPGAYNINPLAYSAIIIPTTTRSVDWSAEKGSPGEAAAFDLFQVVSHDGFEMNVEVRCQYRILPENAPYVVQKIGSIEELEKNVIHPQIDGIFRAQVSRSPAIAYQQNRAEAGIKVAQHEARQVEERAKAYRDHRPEAFLPRRLALAVGPAGGAADHASRSGRAHRAGPPPHDPMVQAYSPARRCGRRRHARLGEQRVVSRRECQDHALSSPTACLVSESGTSPEILGPATLRP